MKDKGFRERKAERKEHSPDIIPEFAELIKPVLERWWERRQNFLNAISDEELKKQERGTQMGIPDEFWEEDN